MASRDREPRFLVLDGGGVPPPSGPPMTRREVVLDELIEALVIFDLLRSDFEVEDAAPLLWMLPRIERIFEEIGCLVAELGE